MHERMRIYFSTLDVIFSQFENKTKKKITFSNFSLTGDIVGILKCLSYIISFSQRLRNNRLACQI
jgi:hypothetical protein